MSSTILIVEPERDLSAPLEFALRRAGLMTCLAEDGEAALQLAAAMPTSALVLLDLMLPDMSGFDVCQQLRADDRTSSLPIVMTSSRVEEICRFTAAACGVDDFVTKPFSLRALTSRCLELLRRGRCEPSRRWFECGPMSPSP